MSGGTARIHIDAPPERVYDLVSDVTRMGEWSPETTRAVWVKGDGPAPGNRFRGYNRHGPARWMTDPVVEVADRPREFTFATSMFGLGRFTRWRYRFEPAGGGTDVEESWESLSRVAGLIVTKGRAAGLQEGMEETLRRIKAAAES